MVLLSVEEGDDIPLLKDTRSLPVTIPEAERQWAVQMENSTSKWHCYGRDTVMSLSKIEKMVAKFYQQGHLTPRCRESAKE